MQYKPKERSKRNNQDQGQTVADVHRPEKISFFTLEFEIANRAALVHSGEQPQN